MRAMLAILLLCSLGFGQGNTGSILGTATDPSSAVIPNLKVTITNVKTGVQSETQSDSLGNYLVQFLPPGLYKIEVEAPGFKKFVRENINLEMNRQLRIDLPLQTGEITETLNITDATPLLETETGTLNTTIENAQVTRLPLLTRDPQQFRLLVPGVVQVRDGEIISQGGLERRDSYFIDGAHSSVHVWTGSPVNPNPDVIQEFKVLSNSFTAEYGQTSGLIMASTTKSGTNEIHGTLFEFFRNDKLNAGDYFAHQKPILRYNQFGGTVGGPVWKNKTFFFFDTQLTRRRGTRAFTNLNVPIEAFKRGDFSSLLGPQVGTDALGRPVFRNQVFDPATARTVLDASGREVVVRDPFPNNQIPSFRFSPAAVKLQELYPTPQINGPAANYNFFGATQLNQYEYDIKIDHHFSQKDKIMGRYSRRQVDQIQPRPFPGALAGGDVDNESRSPNRQLVLNHVHIFSSRATNDLHVSWWRSFPKRLPTGYGLAGTEDFGISGMPNGKEKLGTPSINFAGTGNFWRLGSTQDTLFIERQNSLALVNQTSLIFNRHNVKFGGEVRRLRTDNFQPIPGNTRFTFNNLFTDQRGFSQTGYDYASFLLGLPAGFGYTIFPSFFEARTSVYALFVQDDIRVNRKLSLNFGLRWDAPLYWHERQNRSGIFDLNRGEIVQFGTNGFRRTLYEQDWNNLGPRFGFAYSPFDNSKTIIRGGYGIFTLSIQGVGQSGGLPLAPIFADSDVSRFNTIDQVNWRTTLDRIPYSPADKTGRNSLGIGIFPDTQPYPYYQQWNLNVQQEVRNVLFEVGYAGSRGVHLPYGGYNLNAIPLNLIAEAQGRRIAPYVRYPQYPAGVGVNTWIGSSSYHSLQVKAEKRYAAGLSFLTAYTFQKTIDVGRAGYRDPLNNRNLDRGVEPNSVPHRFTAAHTYELPFGIGRRWLTSGPPAQILGGWELNGVTTLQSGFPLTPATTFDSCLCGAVGNRPNVVGNPRLSGSQRTLDRYFNPDAFAPPALYTIGNAGRALMYGPGLFNMNLSIAKRFYFLGEGRNLEFRAEFYNLTNTPYFANPNTTIGTSTVGRITGVSSDSRQIQMALKFYW